VVQVMARAHKGSLLFAVLLLISAAYSGAFIYRTSFVIDGERYFSLFDDAMVSMRYASNLANGHGLVWNLTDGPVEGFTNPLWTLYMTLPHLLPIAPSKRSLFVQVTSALLLLANLYFVKRIADDLSDGSVPVSLSAVGLTAFYLPINNWSLQGMEVGLLTLLVSIATWEAIRCLRTGQFALRVYIVLALATLVRPDMVVPFVATWAFLVAASPGRARQHLFAGLLILAASALGQTILRLWYFGDILPNTYYLKMTGYPVMLRLSRGAAVLGQFIWSMNPILFSMPLLLLSRRFPPLMFPLWLLLIQMAYSVFVGGDAWEYWGGSNRYLSVVMPGFFILFACAAWRVSQLSTPEPTDKVREARPWRGAAFPILILLGLVTFNSRLGPASLADLFLLRPPLHSGQGGSNMREVREALLLRVITTDKASIAVTRAGTIPYFTERPGVDLLGKTDVHVAHERAQVPLGLRRFLAFRPGHTKLDYEYSVGQLKPDVVAQLWTTDWDRVKPYLDAYYVEVEVEGAPMWLRRDSPNILWAEVVRHGGRSLARAW
jgi:hypothetical protein